MMLKLVAATALLAATALGNACTVSDGTNTFDLSTVPVARGLRIPTSPTLGEDLRWSISLCDPMRPPAPKTCPDMDLAFIFNYAAGSEKCFSGLTAESAWAWNDAEKVARRTFAGGSEAHIGVIAIVSLTCDPAAATLQVDGDATGADHGNELEWHIRLKTRAVCSSRPAPPTPSFFCGAGVPSKVEVRGNTATPIVKVHGVGTQLTCPCLTVASNNSLMASFVKLSVACGASPQGPFAMVKELAQNTGYTAADPVAARCPVRGYFAIVAWNPNSYNAALDYGAKCTVSN